MLLLLDGCKNYGDKMILRVTFLGVSTIVLYERAREVTLWKEA